MSKKTAVVILNWNGRHFLEKFLPEVIRYSGDDAEIVVADNASSDDSIAFLQKTHPSVTIIENHSNEGFTGGYNRALEKVNAEYFVLLNSDVEVTPDWLQPMVRLMDANKKIGACQPKILSYNDKTKFEYAGAGGGFIDKNGYPFCRGRIFSHLETDHGQYNDERPVFWATGACMMIRSSVWKEMDGLDENFFAHMEEIDLCWRLQRAGYQVYYCGKSTVYHVGGGTLPKNNPRKTYLNFRNNLLLVFKNAQPVEFRVIYRFRQILDAIAATKFLITNGYADFKAVFDAHRDFRKMRVHYDPANGRHFSVRAYSFIYKGNIVVEFYLRRRKIFTALKKWRPIR